MEAILSGIQAFFTALMGWFADVAEAIVGEPVLLIFLIAIPTVSFVFSLVSRLIRGSGRRRG